MIHKSILFLFLFTLNSVGFSQNWLQQRIIAEQFDKALDHYDEGRYATADNILQRILKKSAGEYELPVNLLAMKTSLALDQLEEAKALGKTILTQHGQHEYISETFMVLGDIFITEGDMDGAFRMYMHSRQLTDASANEKIDARLISAIQIGISHRTIAEQKLIAVGDNEAVLNLAMSFTHLQKGNPDECAYSLSKIDPALIPEAYFELYETLLLASYHPPMETFTFGVVIALTGKNAQSGKSFLKGLHQSTRRPGMAARWIGEYLDKDSVAAIISSDEFGNAILDEFLKEMDALNKTVIAVERYTGKPENLKKQFQSLRQIAFNLIPPDNPYDEFLGMSFDSLDALFDVNTDDYFELTEEKNEEKIKDSSKVVLSTIQALYIPIHPDHLKYIGTQLPMYNLNTKLVGNLAWNQPDILVRDNVGPHLEGMTILSQKNAFSEDDSPNQNKNDDYLIGYDMSGFITTICNSGITNRTEFITKLEQTEFDGMVYDIAFSPDNHTNSTMHILKCENRSFIPFGTFGADTVQFHVQQRP